MGKIEYIFGDICETKAAWIVHQCNCTTRGTKGLATHIFSKFPYANTYISGRRIPGTVTFHGYDCPNEKQGIVNLYGQYYPGKPSTKESENTRKTWFMKGLEILKTHNKYDHVTYSSFAFPERVFSAVETLGKGLVFSIVIE